jgi:hypothetical protein
MKSGTCARVHMISTHSPNENSSVRRGFNKLKVRGNAGRRTRRWSASAVSSGAKRLCGVIAAVLGGRVIWMKSLTEIGERRCVYSWSESVETACAAPVSSSASI